MQKYLQNLLDVITVMPSTRQEDPTDGSNGNNNRHEIPDLEFTPT